MTAAKRPALSLLRRWRRYRADRRGAAAAEFALVALVLTVPLINVIDLGIYIFQRMEVDSAAQTAIQAALVTCNGPGNLPATPNSYANCPALPGSLNIALHGTGLGTAVTLTSVQENYYCVSTASQTLVVVGAFPARPTPNDCSSVGSALETPGDYLKITASYNFQPLFSDVSVASLLTTPIVRTGWMRLS